LNSGTRRPLSGSLPRERAASKERRTKEAAYAGGSFEMFFAAASKSAKAALAQITLRAIFSSDFQLLPESPHCLDLRPEFLFGFFDEHTGDNGFPLRCSHQEAGSIIRYPEKKLYNSRKGLSHQKHLEK
jgi:hypothetical protein